MLKRVPELAEKFDSYSVAIEAERRARQSRQDAALDALLANAKDPTDAKRMRIHNLYFQECWQQVVAYEESGVRAMMICWIGTENPRTVVIPQLEPMTAEGEVDSILIANIRKLLTDYTPKIETPVIYYHLETTADDKQELRSSACKIMQRPDDPVMRSAVAAAMLAAGYSLMDRHLPQVEGRRTAISRAAHYAAFATAWSDLLARRITGEVDVAELLLKAADAIYSPFRVSRAAAAAAAAEAASAEAVTAPTEPPRD